MKSGPDTHVEDVEYVSARNMAITLVHKGCKLYLVSTYAPCNTGNRSSARYKDDYYRELRTLLKAAPNVQFFFELFTALGFVTYLITRYMS